MPWKKRTHSNNSEIEKVCSVKACCLSTTFRPLSTGQVRRSFRFGPISCEWVFFSFYVFIRGECVWARVYYLFIWPKTRAIYTHIWVIFNDSNFLLFILFWGVWLNWNEKERGKEKQKHKTRNFSSVLKRKSGEGTRNIRKIPQNTWIFYFWYFLSLFFTHLWSRDLLCGVFFLFFSVATVSLIMWILWKGTGNYFRFDYFKLFNSHKLVKFRFLSTILLFKQVLCNV